MESKSHPARLKHLTTSQVKALNNQVEVHKIWTFQVKEGQQRLKRRKKKEQTALGVAINMKRRGVQPSVRHASHTIKINQRKLSAHSILMENSHLNAS